MRPRQPVPAAPVLAAVLAACAAAHAPAGDDPRPGGPGSPARAPGNAPYVLVLGTAQDGGLPQIGCDGPACRAARRDPSRRRLASALLLCDPRSGKRWLLDAGPDLREQVERMHGHPPTRRVPPPGTGRPPLFEGVFPTHAHLGHLSGLLLLGREAYGARGLPVYGTPRLNAFLRANGPWSLLVETGGIVLVDLEPGGAVRLAEDLAVRSFPVVHRGEFTDTVGFVVEGPERSLLYLPDVDAWGLGEVPIEERLAAVDVALVDGTFSSPDEVPGRDLSQVPHPPIPVSLERFGRLPTSERAKVRFTHLNHTNRAADPSSAIAERVRAAGMAVAEEGEIHSLGAPPGSSVAAPAGSSLGAPAGSSLGAPAGSLPARGGS